MMRMKRTMRMKKEMKKKRRARWWYVCSCGKRMTSHQWSGHVVLHPSHKVVKKTPLGEKKEKKGGKTGFLEHIKKHRKGVEKKSSKKAKK